MIGLNLFKSSRHTFNYIFSFALIILTGLIFNSRWDTNDDVLNNLFVLGETIVTQPTESLPGGNFLFGSLLIFLYKFMPGWPIYSIVMYTLFIASFVLLTRLISKKYKSFAIILITLFWALFYLQIWVKMQFTTIAIIASSVAILSSIVELRRNNRLLASGIISSILLFFLASIVRPQSALLSTIIIFVPLFVCKSDISKTEYLKLSAIFLFISLCLECSQAWYCNNTPSRSQFEEMRHAISKLTDYAIVLKTDNQRIAELGWTNNDRALFMDWFSFDNSVFSRSKILDISQHSNMVDNIRLSSWKSGFITQWGLGFFCIALIIIVLYWSKVNLLQICLMVSSFFCIIIFFSIIGRQPPWRVQIGMMFAGAAFSGILGPKTTQQAILKSAKHKFILAIFIIYATWLSLVHMHEALEISKNTESKSTLLKGDLSEIKKLDPNLFIAIGAHFPFEYYFLPFQDKSLLQGIDIFWMAIPGWHNSAQALLKKHHVENFLHGAINRKDIIVITISKQAKEIEIFYKEHYELDLKMVQTFKGKALQGYRLISTLPESRE